MCLALILLLGSVTGTAATQGHHAMSYQIVAEKSLGSCKTSDLFLRQDRSGQELLYIASTDGKLSIYNVTDPTKPSEVRTFHLAGSSEKGLLQLRPITEQTALLTDVPDSSNTWTVLNFAQTPSEQVAKQLNNVDAYTLDAANQIAYIARDGKLIVMRFDHPVTREAEIWQQSYDAR